MLKHFVIPIYIYNKLYIISLYDYYTSFLIINIHYYIFHNVNTFFGEIRINIPST